MAASAPTAFTSLAAWQAMLDAHRDLFLQLVPGAWLGIVPRYRTGPDGTRHSVAVAVTPAVPMVMLIHDGERMTARAGEFRGLKDLSADALFVAGDEAVEQVQAAAPERRLREMKRHVRTGGVAMFFLRPRRELFERGYEELFDALGLPVLGTCR